MQKEILEAAISLTSQFKYLKKAECLLDSIE